MDVHIAPSSLRDNPQDLVWLGILSFQILCEVHSQTLQLRQMSQLLALELLLGLCVCVGGLHVFNQYQL